MELDPRTPGWKYFSIGILLLGLVWIWFGRAAPGSTTNGLIPVPQAGFLAPDFRLKTEQGEEVALSDYRGRPVLVNLWASWCPPCRAEMPALQQVWDDYAGRGFVVLAVNAADQDDRTAAQTFVLDHSLTFPILFDDSGEVSRLYQMRSLPTTFFIGSDGVIQEVIVGGPLSEALLRIRVEQLLAAAPLLEEP